MILQLVLLALASAPNLSRCAAVPNSGLRKRFYGWEDSEPVRGVNIGGWLVSEPFITPSLYESFRTNWENDDGIPPDEYHLTQYLGMEEAERVLLEHWDTWFTERDFLDIAALGFNTVRIPVGYWAFATLDGDPYVSGYQIDYLDRAIQWARNYDLKVWIDLHSAPGSQNGFDNSGLRDQVGFMDGDNLQFTLGVLKYIFDKYASPEYTDTVIGIEVLNEPLGPVIDMERLKWEFLVPAYEYLRNDLGNWDTHFIIHDAFLGGDYWNDFMTEDQGYYGVVIDHHNYQVFSSGELERSLDDHIGVACGLGRGMLSEAHWPIVGEVSAAMTDCTKWLNGVGIGRRLDGSFWRDNVGSYYISSCDGNDDVSTWSGEKWEATRRYIEAQLDAYEMRGGWIWWTYKTESSPEWGINHLLANGLWPNPINERYYPGQCDYY